MRLPLEGIKVLEQTIFAYGPHTGVLLAEMGADIIKIENPAGGDGARALQGVSLFPVAEPNYAFEQSNHSKKSIAVDLSKEEGREIVYKMIPDQDVFLTNLQMPILRKLGMDYETLSKINTKLIYGFGSGWGLRGPLADSPAFDYVAFARSGLMLGLAEPGSLPVCNTPAFGDHISAMTLAFGVMLALFHRERTGEGQMVETSLLGSLIEAASLAIAATLSTGQDLTKTSRKAAGNPLFNYYRCSDGKWLQLGMLQTDLHWHDFCQALGFESIEKDPRFENHQKRCANNVNLISILDDTVRSKPREEWIKRFEGRNIIWGLAQNFLEVTQDPQVLENEMIITFNHPKAGPFRMVGIPVHLSKTPGQIKTAAPELGQHTEEILLELGYTWDDIIRLKDRKVIL